MRRNHMSLFLPAALGLAVLLISADAFALDAWRDRRGLFWGLTLGAGPGQSDKDGADAHIGLDARLRIGAGRSKRLTFDGELGIHHESYNDETNSDTGHSRSFDVTTQLYSAFGAANLFLIDGLYIRGMAGVGFINTEADTNSYIAPDGNGGARIYTDDEGLVLPEVSETGIGFGFGAGYEFFAGADLAVGLGGDARYFIFNEHKYSLITVGFNATWY